MKWFRKKKVQYRVLKIVKEVAKWFGKQEKKGNDLLPEALKNKNHSDYSWPFSLIPRWVTTYNWGIPQQIGGNQTLKRQDKNTGKWGPGPIGEPDTWQVSRFPDAPKGFNDMPLYFAMTTKEGLHIRIGARWDDIDSYVTFPSITIRIPSAYKELWKKKFLG